MNDAIRKQIQSRLAYQPCNDADASQFVDWYKHDVPLLIGEARDLKHQLACIHTQGGDYVTGKEVG